MLDDFAATEIISAEVRTFCTNIHKGPVYLAEAEFGLQQVRPFLETLAPGARVLEVGSGPCIALSAMASSYPTLAFTGMEPMGSGFALFEEFLARIENNKRPFAFHKAGYETFPRTGDWDFVFLVNVFEHLPDWRHFLGFVHDILSPDGRCVILCPNYGFPYESHFRLPILLNKSLTLSVFHTRIERFERDHGWEGLYDSLNFVKLSQVRREAARAGLRVTVHASIIREMIDRLKTDAEFASRQKSIAGLARIIGRSGLLDWLVARPVVQDRLPYMKLELRRDR